MGKDTLHICSVCGKMFSGDKAFYEHKMENIYYQTPHGKEYMYKTFGKEMKHMDTRTKVRNR